MTPIRQDEKITKNNEQQYLFDRTDPSKIDFIFQRGFVRVCPSRNMVQRLVHQGMLIDFIYGFHRHENGESHCYVSTYEDDKTENILSTVNKIAQDRCYGKFLSTQRYDAATGNFVTRPEEGLTEQEIPHLENTGKIQLGWLYSLDKTTASWFKDHQTATYKDIWIVQDDPLLVRLKFSRGDMPRDALIGGLHPLLKNLGWDFAEEAKILGKEELWTLRRSAPDNRSKS